MLAGKNLKNKEGDGFEKRYLIPLVTLVVLCMVAVAGCGPDEPAGPEMMEGSGQYVGQVDGNFVEIMLPDDEAKVFQLSDELKEGLAELGLVENDAVNFTYYEAEDGNAVLVSIGLADAEEPADEAGDEDVEGPPVKPMRMLKKTSTKATIVRK